MNITGTSSSSPACAAAGLTNGNETFIAVVASAVIGLGVGAAAESGKSRKTQFRAMMGGAFLAAMAAAVSLFFQRR